VLAEDAARELPNLPLEDALQLVHLYSDRAGRPVREGGAAVAWAVPDWGNSATPSLRRGRGGILRSSS